ncbi:MAG: hypothetical protein RIC89_00610 [Pseudomonadales bacterium]
MKNSPEDAKPENWHRFFAVESNNRAWELASLATRTHDQNAEMLNCAHAAALHWSRIGTELNNIRAKSLLAEVHALLGFGNSAFELSKEVKGYFADRETDDWELALVHTIHAHAASAASEHAEYESSYALAISAINAIADEEDRKIVLETFNQVPKPHSER